MDVVFTVVLLYYFPLHEVREELSEHCKVVFMLGYVLHLSKLCCYNYSHGM